jgi:membrane-associated phospholipid phosphatase
LATCSRLFRGNAPKAKAGAAVTLYNLVTRVRNCIIVGLICVCCLATSANATAQTTAESSESSAATQSTQLAAPSSLPAPPSKSFWAPFTAAPRDFVNFFSSDTAKILGAATAGIMVVHDWDDEWIAMSQGRLQPAAAFRPGNIGGGAIAQLGGAFLVYSVGKATRLKPVAEVGSDLFRAQLLTQAIVQGMKLTFRRERPDGSSRYSMPSGHTAGAVATATVLQRRYGWKVGIPAYAAGTYVAVARMSANKHHLTDVMAGAAVGLAAGRTVTVGLSKHRFALGVAPTQGGAAITFTKQ